MRVRDILRTKGHDVVTTRDDVPVEAIVHRLRVENIGAVVVTDRHGRIEGIVSERDVVRALSEHGCEALRMPVRSVMTRPVPSCGPDSKLQDVMATMTVRRFRHIPVVDGDELVGIVSIGDLVKYRLDELETETRVLRDYVIGGR
ncbi:MAG: CBS domain-containing protein [Acidimicrobiia bacterium]